MLKPVMKRNTRYFHFLALLLVLHGCALLFRRALQRSPRGPIGTNDDDNLASESITADKDVDDMSKLGDTHVNSTLCQYNECLRGRWVPREPRFETLADFQEVFAKRGGSRWNNCNAPPPHPGTTRTEEEKKRLGEQRIVDIMNWVWCPDRGEQVPWDAVDMVVRLLKTPGGMVFMGDSLTQGHDHAFGSYIQQAGIEFDTNPSHLPFDQGIRTHVLKKGNPVTLELQKLAGVPDSRLTFPIFSVVQEHLLIHEPDLRYLTGLHGAKEGWGWHLGTMKRADDWEVFFRWITESRPGEEDTVTKDTILVLNTGAHWSRGTLYMLPELGSPIPERTALSRLYKTMVKMVIQKFSQLSRLTVFYRATNPGHPQCHLHTKPVGNAGEAHKLEDQFLKLLDGSATSERDIKVRRRWDWDLFNIHNHVWRKEIDMLKWERKALKERDPGLSPRVKWLFIDVYEMALQRPDAHDSPGRDCLHWCLPAMYSEWTHHLYHLLYLEMEQ